MQPEVKFFLQFPHLASSISTFCPFIFSPFHQLQGLLHALAAHGHKGVMVLHVHAAQVVAPQPCLLREESHDIDFVDFYPFFLYLYIR